MTPNYPLKQQVLVDTNNIVHAVYHVNRQCTTVTQLLKAYLIRIYSLQRQFGNLTFAFDGCNARNSQQLVLANYKGTRKSKDPLLVESIWAFRQLLRRLGYTVLYARQQEADQIIGSLALRATVPTIIISVDKDFNQLITKLVTVYDPVKKEMRDEQAVFKRYGITPKQFAFYLALIGDKIDNVPGLFRCGPKSAVKLIQTYTSFARACREIPLKAQQTSLEQKFAQNLPLIKQCYAVVKLKPQKIPECKPREVNQQTIVNFCIKHGYSYDYLFEAKKKLKF